MAAKKKLKGKTHPGRRGGTLKSGGQRGNPMFRQLREIREEIEKRIGASSKVAVLMRMGKKAVEEGDPVCARVFLDYTIGKPMQVRPEDVYPPRIDLPPVSDAKSGMKAIDIATEAFNSGQIGAEALNALMRTIQLRMVALGVLRLDERVAALELGDE